MPLVYLRQLTTAARTTRANRHLARYLAFIAGAANSGGFLAVHQYTSHMSGLVSTAADDLATGSLLFVLHGFAAVIAFMGGAFVTTLLIRWARMHELHSQYALPLLVEAALLIAFGCTGTVFRGGSMLGIVMLLCFTMGLQNAMITKLSGSVIRTTHLTGMVTDIGISLGRLAFSGSRLPVPIAEEFLIIRLLASLILLFFVGGVVGALGFKHFLFTLPLSLLLLMLAAMPVIDDLKSL